MTDKEKLDAIRAEIHRLVDVRGYDGGMANDLFAFMDSLPNEPVSKDFEMALAEMIDKAQKCVVEPLVVAAQWKDELVKLAKSEEPVSEDLKQEINAEWNCYSKDGQVGCINRFSFELIARHFANWQKEQMMAKAIDAQCFGFQGAALFSFRLPADNCLVGSKVKVIVIKED